MKRKRLDALMAERGLTESRNQAQRFIRAGEVRVDGQLVDKPSTQVPEDAEIALKAKPPFVSRGGEKLEAALHRFDIDVADAVAADAWVSGGADVVCAAVDRRRSRGGVSQ